MGDWKYLDIVFKEFFLMLLYWLIGGVLSIIASFLIVFCVVFLFHMRSKELALCILFICFMATAIFTSSKLIKHISALRETEDRYSKEDWRIMERRIFGIEMYVIANIVAALACFGLSIHELIQLL